MSDFDASLMQDFLTESSPRIEQLAADLVKLEAADQSEQADLLNASFRALHTIKGAASFLGLDSVIRFAHVAEDALNRLRKGEIGMSTEVMDALLQSADVVRTQIEQLSSGLEAQEAPEELVAQLKSIIENKRQAEAAAGADTEADATTPTPDAATQPPAEDTATTEPPADADDSAEPAPAAPIKDGLPGTPLNLPPQKQDLLEFMVADMRDYAGQMDEVVEQLGNDATREDAAAQLAEIADNLGKTAEFFELDGLSRAIKLLIGVAGSIGQAPHSLLDEIVVRVKAIKWLIDEQTAWLENDRALSWHLDTLAANMEALARHEAIPDQFTGSHQGDVQSLLCIEGVIGGEAPPTAQGPHNRTTTTLRPTHRLKRHKPSPKPPRPNRKPPPPPRTNPNPSKPRPKRKTRPRPRPNKPRANRSPSRPSASRSAGSKRS